jgi:hypothetical protein
VTNLKNERIIKIWLNGEIKLTNFRVYFDSDQKSKGKMLGSIMLDSLSMIKVEFRSYLFLLIIAGLFGVFGILSLYKNAETGVVLIIISAILVGAFFATRTQNLTFYSKGNGNFNFLLKGLSSDFSNDLISTIENNRFIFLNSLGKQNIENENPITSENL